jgi:hypothetical protein
MTRTISTRNLTDPADPAQPQPAWVRLDDASHGPDAGQYTQGALALTYPLPCGLDALPQSRALTVVPPPIHPVTGANAENWAARFLQGVVEVISCDRPLSQLVRWTDDQVYSSIAKRREGEAARHTSRAGQQWRGRQQVATVHICQLSETAVEVAARVQSGRRSRAIAARLDQHRGRWVCTAIQFE